ncbi:hypothetical protein T265_06031 [Opisthorchis viverrini]|uniref:Uncharacterized protein n=1 Tax=Opisthorchis viverrini TaxID=6198 RepID=A0A074ZTW0_OPIVI|nr:hypothetical protein T265_06031 [Opisthorchis viverrini]KER26825.1 hypothetical protein T265_06031 [Opisthorchis viverrini]
MAVDRGQWRSYCQFLFRLPELISGDRHPHCPLVLIKQSDAPNIVWSSSASKLSRVGNCHLPVWGPRDSTCQWLTALAVMAQSYSQWRSKLSL